MDDLPQTSNVKSYLKAFVAVSAFTLIALVAVAYILPEKDNTAIDTVIVGFGAQILATIWTAIRGEKKVDDNTKVTVKAAQKNAAAIADVKQDVQSVKEDVAQATGK